MCVLVNKRLDEWVEEERLDLNRLQMPKKEDTKKINKGAGSRPCSPDRELVNGVGSGRPKAPVGRKRKANAMDKSSDEVKHYRIWKIKLTFYSPHKPFNSYIKQTSDENKDKY